MGHDWYAAGEHYLANTPKVDPTKLERDVINSLNTRFASIDGRFNGIDGRLDKILKELESVSASVSQSLTYP